MVKRLIPEKILSLKMSDFSEKMDKLSDNEMEKRDFRYL